MERKIVLLGYGMQGKACVYDLSKFGEFDELSVIDCYDGFMGDLKKVKDPRINGYHVDGNDFEKIREHIIPSSLVIEFFPPHLTLSMIELAIECDCHAITSSYVNNPAYAHQPGFSDRLERLEKNAREKGLSLVAISCSS